MNTAPIARDPLRRSLLLLLGAPSVWALHFGASYLWVHVSCDPGGWSPVTRAVVLGAITVAALLALGLVGLAARRGTGSATPDASQMFQRAACRLLRVLSLVAVLWTALGMLLLPACTPYLGWIEIT